MKQSETKKLHYTAGALKRKYKTTSDEPGALLTKYNETKNKKPLPKKKKVSVMGLV